MKKLVIGISSCVDCLDSFRLFREFKLKVPWECPIDGSVHEDEKPPEDRCHEDCPLPDVRPEEKTLLDADREAKIRRLAVEGLDNLIKGGRLFKKN